MDTRLEKLNQMLHRHIRTWEETFTDEETGEEVIAERSEVLDWELSDEERELIETIAADVKSLSDEDLLEFKNAISCFRYRPFDEIFIEFVRRGQDEWASNIDNPATLQELCEKGNKYAAYELYYKHRWGDEANGIFINRKQAREYYDLAGDIPFKTEWDDSDDPGEEDPSSYEYVLTGNAHTLDGVQKLINDLCQRFGIPENVEDGLGMYVPQRILMKVLVGANTEHYRGNIQEMKREAPDRLIITTEADRGEPLLYALRQCFTNLEIEMKETEW